VAVSESSKGRRAEPGDNWLYELKWESAPLKRFRPSVLPELLDTADRLQETSSQLGSFEGLSVDAGFLPMLARLSAAYSAQALDRIGYRSKELKVRRPYDRLLARMIAMTGSVREDPAALHREAMRRYPACEAEFKLLAYCAENLPSVLSGERSGPEVLFPGGDLSMVRDAYFSSPIGQAANRLVVEAIEEAIRVAKGGAPLRILEIGGGTGATTAVLLPLLDGSGVDYLFTDVSRFFLTRAARTFAQYPFVRYKTLDISRAPDTQDFPLGQFDIVIAANVLHATPVLEQSLAFARQLLAPGGWLLLSENTGPQPWLDLTFGLTEEWWNSQDTSLRPAQPLLSAAEWVSLLARSGFQHATSVAGVRYPDGEPQNALLMAQLHRPAESWVVLADASSISSEFCKLLEIEGRDFRLASCGDLVPATGPNSKVVFFGGLGNRSPEDFSYTESAARVVGNLAGAPAARDSRLWLVTQNAQHVGGESVLPVLDQAALWGFGRVLALEHPEIWGGIVDLPADVSPEEAARSLLDAIGNAGDEDQIAVRADRQMTPRLVRANLPKAATPKILRPDKTYLITGGTGKIGLQLAGWLAQKGARSLVLTSRSGATTDFQLDQIEHIRKTANVEVVIADAGNREEMARLIGALDGKLAGVIHAAGTTEFRPITDMDGAAVHRSLYGKALGAWHLHELTAHLSLDFFVLFSSGASVWGSIGAAHYAAANAVLDLLAHYRRDRGLPALSINWGFWEDPQEAALEKAQFLERSGLRPMSSNEALALFGRLLESEGTQLTAADIDWSIFTAMYETRRPRPLIEHLRSRGPAKPRLTLDKKAALPGSGGMLEYVRGEVAAVMGIKSGEWIDPLQPLFEMGIDSLMAVELRNRLETATSQALPATFVFNHPTIQAIAGFIEGKRTETKKAEPAAAPADQGMEPDPDGTIEETMERELALAEQLVGQQSAERAK